ncbi:MAG: DUF222 domain-containing protein [Mycobacterium sp.]
MGSSERDLSDPHGIIECMFDAASPLLVRLRAAARAENRAAGERLAVVGELDVLWLRQVGERESWCTDTQEALTAEIAAALTISQGLAGSYLYYSRALRMRLPASGRCCWPAISTTGRSRRSCTGPI